MDIYDLGSNGDSETGRIYLCLLICNFLYIKELWKQMGNLDLWGYERNKKKTYFPNFFAFLLPLPCFHHGMNEVEAKWTQ